ncbi:hypothetical protein DFP72DRAFT_845055 [Ephemerocybe angulata]|uniref:RING-type domain-containing protein n=1 Tax=Ephemerocybe angulata TaxID=980116 RepID=A0A8H6MAB9_9AGAR|nr:hypothetical protein DFP72DRAFT_845055 [Tulosesus angulatus]
MPATKLLCSVCCDAHELSEFRFLKCGHGFCNTCTERIRISTSTCALCNTPYGEYPPRPIYAELVEDTPEARTRRLTADLSTIQADPSLENLRNLPQRLRDAEHQSGEGMSTDHSETLLAAARTIETVVTPLMEKVEKYRGVNRRNSKLRKQNDELQAQLRLLESQLTETRSQNQALLRDKEQLSEERSLARSEVEELQRLYAIQKVKTKSLKDEFDRANADYQQKIERLQKSITDDVLGTTPEVETKDSGESESEEELEEAVPDDGS